MKHRKVISLPFPKGSTPLRRFFQRDYLQFREPSVDIQFKIVGPTHENRRIFETFVPDWEQSNVAIGRLKSFMRGTGIDVDNVPLNAQSLIRR